MEVVVDECGVCEVCSMVDNSLVDLVVQGFTLTHNGSSFLIEWFCVCPVRCQLCAFKPWEDKYSLRLYADVIHTGNSRTPIITCLTAIAKPTKFLLCSPFFRCVRNAGSLVIPKQGC